MGMCRNSMRSLFGTSAIHSSPPPAPSPTKKPAKRMPEWREVNARLATARASRATITSTRTKPASSPENTHTSACVEMHHASVMHQARTSCPAAHQAGNRAEQNFKPKKLRACSGGGCLGQGVRVDRYVPGPVARLACGEARSLLVCGQGCPHAAEATEGRERPSPSGPRGKKKVARRRQPARIALGRPQVLADLPGL